MKSAIEKFQGNGWVFKYEPGTKCIWAYHPGGGKQPICKLVNHFEPDAFGTAMAKFLNKKEDNVGYGMRKVVLIAILAIMFLAFIASFAKASDNVVGIGVFYGENIPTSSRYTYDCIIIHPTYGWVLSDPLKIYLEGDIGCYKFDKMDAYSLGISVMVEYILIGPIYLEAGLGISHWDNTPCKNTLRNGLVGLAKAGTGVKIQLDKNYTGKIGYRFTHSSEVFADDTGVNAHGIMFSISKSF